MKQCPLQLLCVCVCVSVWEIDGKPINVWYHQTTQKTRRASSIPTTLTVIFIAKRGWAPAFLTSLLSSCHHEAYYWFHWHPHNVTTEWSLTKLRHWQIADSPSHCCARLPILHLAQGGGSRSISSLSGRNEARALCWRWVQIYVGEKRKISVHRGLRVLLMKRMCWQVCLPCRDFPSQYSSFQRE